MQQDKCNQPALETAAAVAAASDTIFTMLVSYSSINISVELIQIQLSYTRKFVYRMANYKPAQKSWLENSVDERQWP